MKQNPKISGKEFKKIFEKKISNYDKIFKTKMQKKHRYLKKLNCSGRKSILKRKYPKFKKNKILKTK